MDSGPPLVGEGALAGQAGLDAVEAGGVEPALTGARWSVDGAEAVLKLRAVRANGDWSSYWQHHLAQQRQRVHASRYADGLIPQAA